MALDPVVPRSRRNLLTAAVGGLAGLLVGTLARPADAEATTGTMVYGTSMDADTDQTSLTSSNAANTAVFQNTGTGQAIQAIAASISQAAILGANTSIGTGVFGGSNGGVGIRGASTSGNGVLATSTSGDAVTAVSVSALGVGASSTTGIGVGGQTNAVDKPAVVGLGNGGNTGVFGLSGGGLGPGTPVKTGVYGFATQDSTAVGVTGESTVGCGMVARAATGVGLVAFVGPSALPTAPLGTAIFGAGATGGYDLVAGGSGRMRLVPGPDAGTPPAPFVSASGDLFCDATGSLWLCVAGGAPGTFRQIGGPTTAGALHPIAPARVYDSRLSGGAMSLGAPRMIQVATATAGGTVVPPGAIAIAYNLTVTGTLGMGWLALIPAGAAFGGTSSINWFGSGQTLANGGIVKLGGDRRCDVWIGGQTGAATQIIIDITGFYL